MNPAQGGSSWGGALTYSWNPNGRSLRTLHLPSERYRRFKRWFRVAGGRDGITERNQNTGDGVPSETGSGLAPERDDPVEDNSDLLAIVNGLVEPSASPEPVPPRDSAAFLPDSQPSCWPLLDGVSGSRTHSRSASVGTPLANPSPTPQRLPTYGSEATANDESDEENILGLLFRNSSRRRESRRRPRQRTKPDLSRTPRFLLKRSQSEIVSSGRPTSLAKIQLWNGLLQSRCHELASAGNVAQAGLVAGVFGDGTPSESPCCVCQKQTNPLLCDRHEALPYPLSIASTSVISPETRDAPIPFDRSSSLPNGVVPEVSPVPEPPVPSNPEMPTTPTDPPPPYSELPPLLHQSTGIPPHHSIPEPASFQSELSIIPEHSDVESTIHSTSSLAPLVPSTRSSSTSSTCSSSTNGQTSSSTTSLSDSSTRSPVPVPITALSSSPGRSNRRSRESSTTAPEPRSSLPLNIRSRRLFGAPASSSSSEDGEEYAAAGRASSNPGRSAASLRSLGLPEAAVEFLEGDEARRNRSGYWPHGCGSLFATLTCTIGAFNVCRFSYLSFQYGGGFILQFLMLTIVLGIPMLTLQMATGQFLGAGMVDMWRISPVFQGVGIASTLATAMLAIYNAVPISWFFIYFRDSFISAVTFKWGDCRNLPNPEECLRPGFNTTDLLRKTVPSYFSNRVLQRRLYTESANSGELIFENVFNLAVIWMIVFISLSKGIKSYGKVVLAFGILPIFVFYLITIEILRRAGTGAETLMNLNTDLSTFFSSSWSWLAAAREVFFVWGLNGAAIMQIASHNKIRHNLRRDCFIVIVVTLSVVLLSAFLACACLYIIYKADRFNSRYVPSSYEREDYMQFLLPLSQAMQVNMDVTEYKSNNYFVGVASANPESDTRKASGYQVTRLATELFPMAMVMLSPRRISAFWPIIFYLALIILGLAQQLALWRSVVEGLISVRPDRLKAWETMITFLTCVVGFFLAFPFTTPLGIFAVHFMDVCVGSAWWIMIIYAIQAFALFLVRGRPYGSEEVASLLLGRSCLKQWFSPILMFSWNVVIPVSLVALAIASYHTAEFGLMFSWNVHEGYIYWPVWARQLGCFIQVIPIVIIPLVALIQTTRYLSTGSADFRHRLQMLYRPVVRMAPDGEASPSSTESGMQTSGVDNPAFRDDPPPKYTPPPSYNTATGLKLLKRLNSSIRRSFRNSLRRSQVYAANADIEMRGESNNAETTNRACNNETRRAGIPSWNTPTLVATSSTLQNSNDGPPSYTTAMTVVHPPPAPARTRVTFETSNDRATNATVTPYTRPSEETSPETRLPANDLPPSYNSLLHSNSRT